MSASWRVNGSAQFAVDTLVSVYQLKAFVVDAGATLANQDGPEVDQAVEAIVRELSPLMYYTKAGKVHVIVDGHAVDKETLQLRLRHLGTVNGFDLSVATVTEGTSLTVA